MAAGGGEVGHGLPSMRHIPLTQARARLCALLDRVEAGEEIIITRCGKPIARLIPEHTAGRSAADIFRAVWAQGGLDIDAPAELAMDVVDLD